MPLALLAGACTPSDAERAKAESQRATLEGATPALLASRLRDLYAAERACLDELAFPAVVFLDTDSTGAVDQQGVRLQRKYEVLRDAGLVAREDVYPGDRDWRLPPGAHVDSGGRKRIVRYVLTTMGRGDSEPVADASDPDVRRLCYARRRLVSVDSVVTRGPTLRFGVAIRDPHYAEAGVHAGHRLVFDSVASWADDVARRDSLQDLGLPRGRLREGVQFRWASFGVDGDGQLRRPYFGADRPRY